jgi:hypothetical protein
MVNPWGEEVETGVNVAGDEIIDPPADPPAPNPGNIDINTMSTQEFMALQGWQFQTVLAQVIGELNSVQRRRAELAVFYYEYKSLQERERNLVAQKSACQTILRTERET